MAMLTNGAPRQSNLPGPQCSLFGQDQCGGNLHVYEVEMVAKLDGTPVVDAPKEQKFIICERHYPDASDPKFLLCACRLCGERKGRN